ncbi:glycerophosphodiester phosphodiesterase [Altererythrobacter xixiisoli]|uniref:Glycerophosphodiester phosphodiesterase n=1 Tax=Croceibacterium xixiisoli TaxID=1476466 RepID=A0A6I4TZP5_9SPHN|nr:glycerophosphodiester phosphodiesterase family protein [Croceibacterium xixiisoli]MXP00158.1 glycerophosphodiester phosphodiesterase [Croceibacterium xixiisoli]
MQSLLWRLFDKLLVPAPEQGRVGWLTRFTYAHRGLHSANVVENSRTAFAGAIARGLGIECDVRKTRDGRAIVFHDETLDRLTGESGPVATRSVGEITRILLSGSDEHIPTLRDLVAQIGSAVPLLIELKTRRERPVGPLCLAVRAELEGYSGAVAVMSFDPRVAKWFARHAPNLLRGLVMSEADGASARARVSRRMMFWRARPDFLAYDIASLPSSFVAEQRARRIPVLAWTVTGAEHAALAISHADACIAEGEGLVARDNDA